MPKPGDVIQKGPHTGKTYVDLQTMVDAIEHDQALLRGDWCDSSVKLCGHAGRCAMGAIMAFIGIPNWWLDDHAEYARKKREPGVDYLGKAIARVEARLGLNEDDQDHIMIFNDDFRGRPFNGVEQAARERAQAVVGFFREEFGPRDVARAA